jgi:hypothetical protein
VGWVRQGVLLLTFSSVLTTVSLLSSSSSLISKAANGFVILWILNNNQ